MNAPEPTDLSFPIVAIDFDGILARPIWPEQGLGRPIPRGIELARHFHEEDVVVIVYTARPWRDHPVIHRWLREHEVPFDQIVCEKPQAALYIDDRAFRPDWVQAEGGF